MKTKIVYSVVCKSENFFIEQLYCSVYSLRMYNKNCYVVIVVDSETNKLLEGKRGLLLPLIDEKIVVDVPNKYTTAQKSRYLKTSLRNHINGDFLFIDSDTIITSDISQVDLITDDICAVPDKHMFLREHSDYPFIQESANRIGWIISDDDKYYFNSGVMFVKDNPKTRRFYELWHQRWLETTKPDFHPDQPSLNMVNKELGYPMVLLDDKWNCQISDNGLRYLSQALIIHYFNSTIRFERSDYLYYFMNPCVLHAIKENDLCEKDLFYLKHPLEAFSNKVILLSGVARVFYFSDFTQWWFSKYIKKSKFYRVVLSLYSFLKKIK